MYELSDFVSASNGFRRQMARFLRFFEKIMEVHPDQGWSSGRHCPDFQEGKAPPPPTIKLKAQIVLTSWAGKIVDPYGDGSLWFINDKCSGMNNRLGQRI